MYYNFKCSIPFRDSDVFLRLSLICMSIQNYKYIDCVNLEWLNSKRLVLTQELRTSGLMLIIQQELSDDCKSISVKLSITTNSYKFNHYIIVYIYIYTRSKRDRGFHTSILSTNNIWHVYTTTLVVNRWKSK